MGELTHQYFTNLLAYIGYFLLGNILFVNKADGNIKIMLISFAVYIIASYFTLHKTYQLSILQHNFYGLYYGYSTINVAIASIAIFISLTQIDINKKRTASLLQSISNNGLGIYLAHPLFIKILVIDKIVISNLFEALALSSIVFMITFLLTYLMKKISYIKTLV